MSLQNIKNQKGFTIVELLIVIVVIGILAAIVIVAYNGVTNRANTANAQGNAKSVQKVVEAMHADTSNYPSGADANAVIASITAYSGTANGVAKLPSGVDLSVTNPTSGTGKTRVGYKATGTTSAPTGGCVAYWDFAQNKIQWLGIGDATINNTAATPTCS